MAFLAMAAVAAMAAARAWTGDDAFITFRVVEQLLAGHGPVFNTGERVQVFTHPLWLVLLTLWRAAGGPLFPGVMGLSVALFVAASGLLAWTFRDKPAAIVACAGLVFFSRTVVDFASGGLETPLSFLLLAAAVHALRTDRPRLAIAWLCLLPLNRLDLLPWAAVFAWTAAAPGARSRIGAMAWLVAPALAWVVFSTIYYGAPLPNTANAKLAEPLAARLDPGLGYVVASLAVDPGSLALMLMGFIVGFGGWKRGGLDGRIAAASLAAATVACAYAVWCGGDFMLGRFLLPALWAAMVAVPAGFPRAAEDAKSLGYCALTFGTLAVLVALNGSTTTQLWLGLEADSPRRNVFRVGAVDERRNYIPWFGAFSREPVPRHADEPVTSEPRLIVGLGWESFFGKLDQAYVDQFALADPLLARIAPVGQARPGHAYRPYPGEFWRWRDPTHAFGDVRLDALASDLRLAHRHDSIWSAHRWQAIARLLTTGPVGLDALRVREGTSEIDFDVQPWRLYRPDADAPSYEVWLRLYDEAAFDPPVRFPAALDAACKPYAVPGAIDASNTIEVRGRETLRLRCPRAYVDAAPIAMRIGAPSRDASGQVRFDDIVGLTRPRLWWLDAVPLWLTQGWRERPRPALAQAVVLAFAALAFAWRCRRVRL